jgi:aldose 1-epimerase
MDQNDALAPDGQAPQRVRLSCDGLQLELMDWGATWLSCQVPMAGGALREVLLGCPTMQDWFAQKCFLNATVGRYANRIAGARITRAGKEIRLAPNPPGGPHQLHGGPLGFSERRWAILEQSELHVCFGLHSADGDQGFPGNVEVRVTYRLSPGQRISMVCEATTDAATPFGITQHAYFNLDGIQSDVREHTLQIKAAYFVPVDPEMIPLEGPVPVAGSSFDFQAPHKVGHAWENQAQIALTGGYDHAFLLDAPSLASTAASLSSASGDLRMDFYTEAPAIQLYTGQHLGSTAARGGGNYAALQGICLEPGYLPDSPNHPEWPQADCWLQPGQALRQESMWVFLPSA